MRPLQLDHVTSIGFGLDQEELEGIFRHLHKNPETTPPAPTHAEALPAHLPEVLRTRDEFLSI